MKKIFLKLFLLYIFFEPDFSFGQCSDAGVCRIGRMGDKTGELLSISFSYNNGYSGKEDQIIFHTFQLGGAYKFFPSGTLNILIPYNMQYGPLGNAAGIGDLILSWDQDLFSVSSVTVSASAGIKLGTGNENSEPALPQSYQPGLGSNSLIAAINLLFNEFVIGGGYQTGGGRNDKKEIRLKRGDNLLLRASYLIPIQLFQIKPQFLFIKPLSKSTILDLNSPAEKYIEVDKSDQPQLNVLTELQYSLSENYTVYSELAFPLLKRESNIDGLKRAFTAALGFRYSY